MDTNNLLLKCVLADMPNNTELIREYIKHTKDFSDIMDYALNLAPKNSDILLELLDLCPIECFPKTWRILDSDVRKKILDKAPIDLIPLEHIFATNDEEKIIKKVKTGPVKQWHLGIAIENNVSDVVIDLMLENLKDPIDYGVGDLLYHKRLRYKLLPKFKDIKFKDVIENAFDDEEFLCAVLDSADCNLRLALATALMVTPTYTKLLDKLLEKTVDFKYCLFNAQKYCPDYVSKIEK